VVFKPESCDGTRCFKTTSCDRDGTNCYGFDNHCSHTLTGGITGGLSFDCVRDFEYEDMGEGNCVDSQGRAFTAVRTKLGAYSVTACKNACTASSQVYLNEGLECIGVFTNPIREQCSLLYVTSGTTAPTYAHREGHANPHAKSYDTVSTGPGIGDITGVDNNRGGVPKCHGPNFEPGCKICQGDCDYGPYNKCYKKGPVVPIP